jgi:hypothetical protein
MEENARICELISEGKLDEIGDGWGDQVMKILRARRALCDSRTWTPAS